MSIKYIKLQKEFELSKQLQEIIPNTLSFTLGLCGGRSIISIIQALKEIVINRNSSFKAIMLDERIVPADNPDSNYKVVSEALREGNNISELFSILQFDTQDVLKGISEYESFLKEYDFSLDLIFLGVGEDGHIAGLFPGLNEIKEQKEKVLIFDNSPKPPSNRMTLSLPILLKSKTIVLLFIGEGKRSAFNRFNDHITSEYDCPVKFFLNSKNCFVLSDLI
jgi:6-phosphogluconolactonase